MTFKHLNIVFYAQFDTDKSFFSKKMHYKKNLTSIALSETTAKICRVSRASMHKLRDVIEGGRRCLHFRSSHCLCVIIHVLAEVLIESELI